MMCVWIVKIVQIIELCVPLVFMMCKPSNFVYMLWCVFEESIKLQGK
jgi:hypothetical protein